jgi:uncharacterized protein GlcG (DUF336 family)
MMARNFCLGLLALAAMTTNGRSVTPTLTVADVNTIVAQAAQAAKTYSQNSVVAVTDREGYVLAVYGVTGPTSISVIKATNAISKAGTAAYLSSGGEAFTTRTAGFIIQDHFPPGINNVAPGPLFGVGLSSLPFSDINHFRSPVLAVSNQGIANTTLSGNPGGVPLYKNGVLVGGVGIDSNAGLSALNYVAGGNIDEDIAVIAQNGYAPPAGILATQVLINGIQLPYTDFNGGSLGTTTLVPANFAPGFSPAASPGKAYNAVTPSPFSDVAGEVRNQIIGSTLGPVNGQPRLSRAEVLAILHQAALRSQTTRAAIRNPIGPAEVFIVVVDYYNPSSPPGTTAAVATSPPTSVPQVLGSFRTTDATIFSYDVAAQKARTALFFSNNTMAMSSRCVGFLAQDTYPPGINGTAPGPYGYPAGPLNPNSFQSLQSKLSLVGGGVPTTPVNAFLPNGITVFPGGFPLYRNGVLIGAVGVSGDGVDQDDLIAASGTVGFEAPTAIRSDNFTYRGARLPYAKFPQNASLP